MLRGFISYSHRDTQFLDELKISLKSLERDGRVIFWTDQAIDAAEQWQTEIMAQLEMADIAIILLSRPKRRPVARFRQRLGAWWLQEFVNVKWS